MNQVVDKTSSKSPEKKVTGKPLAASTSKKSQMALLAGAVKRKRYEQYPATN